MGVAALGMGSQLERVRAVGRSLPLRRAHFLVLVVAVVAAGLGMAGARVVGAGSGPELYARNCAECHGPRGGRIPAAPLDSPAFMSRLGEVSLYKTIAEGKGTMPASGRDRGGPLGDAEIQTLVGYLLSPERAGPGRELYQRECASCHGDKGNRIPAALLNSRQLLDRKTDRELAQAIAEGKGAMPALGDTRGGPLSQQDTAAVVSFMRTLAGSPDPGPRPPGAAPAPAAAPAAAAPRAASSDAGPQGGGDKAQELFKTNCAACHPSLSVAKPDPAQVQKAIADGIASKGMPAFGGRLSKDDVELLAQFVASGKAGSGGGGGGGGAPANPFSGLVRHVDGWILKHPAVVKESGTQLCSKCHQPSYCVTCHTGGRVKP